MYGKVKSVSTSLLLLACLVLGLQSVRATVILELEFEELVAQSQLIFEGRVVRSEQSEIDGLVYTTAWFVIDDLIKGDSSADLSLRFLGGDTGSRAVEVAGQYVPQVGDHAVYFVAEPYRDQVNPLTGWHQGAFLIDTDVNGTAMMDLSQRPDLVLFNMRGDPLVRKMLATGFSVEQIRAKFPAYLNFPLADFKAALRSLGAE